MKHLKLYAKVLLDKENVCLVYESRRARNSRLSISSGQGLRLIIPRFLPEKNRLIIDILRQKLPWIKKQIERQKIAEKNSYFLNQKLTPQFRKMARDKIVRRVNELAKQYGFYFNKIYLKTQKTRWGSASTKKNLSFNLRIAQLPEEVMDYVILHELMHLKYPNHSRTFWQALKKICPSLESYKKYLKNIRI